MNIKDGRCDAVALDHSGDRESVVLSRTYTELYNEVWLAVRKEVLVPAGAEFR